MHHANLSWLLPVFVRPVAEAPDTVASQSFAKTLPSTPGPTTSRVLSAGDPATPPDEVAAAKTLARCELEVETEGRAIESAASVAIWQDRRLTAGGTGAAVRAWPSSEV